VSSVAAALPPSSAVELLSAVRVAPSILAADHGRLIEQVQTVLDAGARVIHCDVMDGRFVPPITFGPIIVAALADVVHRAGAILDVHLMIERPEGQVAEFARAGADLICMHAEATPHLDYALRSVRDAGCMAGVAINPGTGIDAVDPVLDLVDLVLCMTVNPGWGGQPFIESTLSKVGRLRELLPDRVALEVDGGVGPRTAAACVARGANLLVAGSAVFGPRPAEAYLELAAVAGAI
jgi:ribulose-phosphate 3-epimerase